MAEKAHKNMITVRSSRSSQNEPMQKKITIVPEKFIRSMVMSEVKFIPHIMKYVAVPSLIKSETSGARPQPARLARICFMRARPRSVLCVATTAMLEVLFTKLVIRMRKSRLARDTLSDLAVLIECNKE